MLSNTSQPKYSQSEIERRWLVDLDRVNGLEQARISRIEDRYLRDTLLRLRKVVNSDSQVVYKLGKKYGRSSGLTEYVVNAYLTETEYAVFANLPARCSYKLRHAIAGGALDVYQSPHPRLAVFEIDFPTESAAERFAPPDFVTREVTAFPAFHGANLACDESADAWMNLSAARIFGNPPKSNELHPRFAAYVVMQRADGRVAVVSFPIHGRQHFWLPGGGQWPNETPQQTIEREVREELGHNIAVGPLISQAVQYFHASDEDRWYEMQAGFYAGTLLETTNTVPEFGINWIDPLTQRDQFFHECHAWAANQ